ncbi:hypothetical protein JCM10296v2_004197 [Rhodotorula toruloides]
MTVAALPPARDLSHHLNDIAKNRFPSPLKDIFNYMGRPGMISMAGGLPHPSLFPFNELALQAYPPSTDLSEGVPSLGEQTSLTIPKYPSAKTDTSLTSILQYGDCSGSPALRAFLHQFTLDLYQPAYSDFQILLHEGNTSGWTKVVRLLLEPRDGQLKAILLDTANSTDPSLEANGLRLRTHLGSFADDFVKGPSKTIGISRLTAAQQAVRTRSPILIIAGSLQPFLSLTTYPFAAGKQPRYVVIGYYTIENAEVTPTTRSSKHNLPDPAQHSRISISLAWYGNQPASFWLSTDESGLKHGSPYTDRPPPKQFSIFTFSASGIDERWLASLLVHGGVALLADAEAPGVFQQASTVLRFSSYRVSYLYKYWSSTAGAPAYRATTHDQRNERFIDATSECPDLWPAQIGYLLYEKLRKCLYDVFETRQLIKRIVAIILDLRPNQPQDTAADPDEIDDPTQREEHRHELAELLGDAFFNRITEIRNETVVSGFKPGLKASQAQEARFSQLKDIACPTGVRESSGQERRRMS